MTRHGWTLHEMLISLCVMAVAVGLASHAAVVHLRFFRGAGEIIATRSQIGAVGSIVAATLWGVSPRRGDLVFASDSALEVRAAIGASVTCDSATGRLILPAAEASGNTLSAFDSPPDAGDVADVFVHDSVGVGWMRTTVAAVETGDSCLAFPQSGGGPRLTLREPLTVPRGALVRLSRPVRLSHYRASDGLWYFGVRDWNSAAQRLNTIQPVAGPLEPHSADGGTSGLAFHYYDSTGTELANPSSGSSVVTVVVVARGKSRRVVNVAGMAARGAYLDSISATVTLRNAR